MGWIPGWESIQATGWWGGFFFWASIVSLIGLGISEVASHRYSERRDELIETQQQVEKERHDDEIAQLHLETAQANRDAETAKREVATAQAETAKANERTAELKLVLEREIAARQPRTINPEARARIAELLRNDRAPKGRIVVIWKLFDEEAEQFAKQTIEVLKEGGFDTAEGSGPLGFSVKGAWIIVRDFENATKRPNALGTLQAAFRDVLNIELDGKPHLAGFPDEDVIVAIGAKP